MPPKKYYQWERFWCPNNGTYSLDHRGFLVDPKAEWGKYYKDSIALTFDEIPATTCLALLGEPGMGKTKALHDAYQSFLLGNQNKSLWFDLRSFTTDVGLISGLESDPLIADWIKGDYRLSLFLDSLDEGLLNLKTMAAVLIEIIKRWPRKRLDLKIACRVTDWPGLFDSELPALFILDQIPKYELLPLRAIDVEQAASVENIDPAKFMKATIDAEVTAFASRPITLNFLLDSYKLKDQLPERKSDIYELGCLDLCQERNLSRLDSKNIGKLSSAQRIIIAARIASVMMLSNKYAIWTAVQGNVENEDLSISLLTGFFEKIYGQEFLVDEDAIKETLGTGLFNSRGTSRLGFSHQTFLEYLAAYYLFQKHVPLHKILELVTYSDGKIIPQLQETAIWLATLSVDVFNALFEAQPEIMLRVPKDALVDKKRTLKKLLSHYETGVLVDHYQLFSYFNRLEYFDMARELRPYIVNNKFNIETRRVAILIAGECKVNDLADTLVSVALNPVENHSIRSYAVDSIIDLKNDKARIALLPLALNDVHEDTEDELKGMAFKAVWGKIDNIDELLESIQPVRNEDLIGTYYHFLSYEFADLIRVEHIAQALNWLVEKKINLGNEILVSHMHQNLMLKAWDHLENEEILVAFAKLAFNRILGYQESRVYSDEKTYTSKLPGNPARRHALVNQITTLMTNSKEAFHLVYSPPFLFLDDIDWIIENIKNADSGLRREIWVQLLFYLVDMGNQDFLAKAYEVYIDYPEAKSVFSNIFEPVELDSPLAKTLRDYENNSKVVEQKKTKESLRRVNHHSQLLLYIDQFKNGDLDAWWKLNLLILDSDPKKVGSEFDVDLTSFSIWESLDVPTRDDLILMAVKYLDQHLGGEIYLEDGRIYRPAVAGFRAFYLIAIKSAELLSSISTETWNKWASVILSYPVFDNKVTKATHQILASNLIQYSRQQFYDFLQKQIDKEEKIGQYLKILDLLEHLDTEELQNFLVEVLETKGLSLTSFGQLIRFLLERNNLRAKQISIEILQLKTQNDDILLQKKLRVAKSLLLYSNNGEWQVINNQIKKDTNFGEKLFLGLAYERHGLANMLVNKLSESEIVELYIWLETIFPEAEDIHAAGMHEVTDRESVAQIRDSLIPALAEKGNNQAGSNIKYLITRYPEKNNLIYYLRRCEEKTRSNNWIPNQPYVVLEIARNAYKEYIQHQRTILNYIIGVSGIIAMLLVDFLLNTLNYDRLDFFKSNQILPIGLILVLTVIIMVLNFNRPIPD